MKVNFIQNSKLEDNHLILQANQKNDLIETIIYDIESNIYTIECSIDDHKMLTPMHSFIRFMSADKKIFGYTQDKELTIKYRLYQLEELLPSQFVRISNTEIINIHAVSNLELTHTGIILIHFKNGEQTSSSRRYLKKIKEKLL